ncbi:hypothetical protein ACNKHV_07880 [Shigella flexneri]
MLGENTKKGGVFREELNETHQLFKEVVKRMHLDLDMNRWQRVNTGTDNRQWERLVDEINTSDEVILTLMEEP